MLLALIPLASADLPWECPPLAEPADGLALDDDGGLVNLLSSLEAEAWAQDAGCDPWNDTWKDHSGSQTCTATSGATITFTWLEWSDVSTSGSEWSLEVTLPEGVADWTWLQVGEVYDGGSATGSTSWSDTTRTATWVGTPLGLPADTTVSYESWSGSDGASGSTYSGQAGTTATCDWSWREESGAERTWTASNGDHVVVVSREDTCSGGTHTYATYDGALYGAVDLTTWVLDEEDRDGWSVADGDCDDADPLRYPCADETAGDGLDSDCDEVDETDADGDGHDAVSVGGDDCDDASRWTYPGRDDRPGDGYDVDCDGHDDVDADGDGYTADGDDLAADCDDANAAVYPGAADVPDDGLDTDCDGTVETVEDIGDTGDTGAIDTGAPPQDEEEDGGRAASADGGLGCGGGKAGLLVLPLVLARRRRLPV